jgi:hypothetical protein
VAFGRKVPEQTAPQSGADSSSTISERTTSYPQGQEGKAPVAGALRTTSYQSSLHTDTRGYETIN